MLFGLDKPWFLQPVFLRDEGREFRNIVSDTRDIASRFLLLWACLLSHGYMRMF